MILTFLFNRLWSSFCAGNNIMANFRPLNLNDLLNPPPSKFYLVSFAYMQIFLATWLTFIEP